MQIILMTCIVAFAVSYFIVEKIGFFSDSPLSNPDILYSVPMLSASIVLLLATIISFIKKLKRSGNNEWIMMLSLLLIVSGFWISFLTRFSGEVVLTEGQTFYSGHDSYIPNTIYRGRFSHNPEIALELVKISPSLSKDGLKIAGIEGIFKIPGKEQESMEEVKITTGLPFFHEGSMFNIKEFGYSPRYELKSKEGKILDSSFVYMNLFPPGSEDNFRLLSPLTYYVRYFPFGKDENSEPLIGLRIVRNKDIVFNDQVHVAEEVSFENSKISFEEVRQWTRLSVVHDRGVLIASLGMILGLISVILRSIKRA